MNAAALFAGGFTAGLAAGTASCTAVQGGLLIGLIRRPAKGRSDGALSSAGDCCDDGEPDADRSGDLAAVGAFLSGRLFSHIAAGALLGMLGSAVQVSPTARAALLVAAGIAVVVQAVRLLRKGGSHSTAGCSGHSAGTAIRTRTSGVARGLALGVATILVPCGVTISLEIVAVSTGSVIGGAAVLGGFAIGTAPAFAALGLLLRRLASTRLAVLAGVAAVAAGVLTIGSGLRLGGWLPGEFPFPGSPATASGPSARTANGAQAAQSAEGARVRQSTDGTRARQSTDGTRARQDADGVQRITIWATDYGFRPGIVTAAADRATEIVFRTDGARGCTRTVAIDDRDVALPDTGEETVRLPPHKTGQLSYACGMGMYVGFIRFG
ncbi:sulfite exporter TauE/SafE family protein [Planotetraspora sp. GP83]|uniref:sulfite exporter TauE/SafE family protein n=1 Tax=Planotetraspora sp. GP83 TaxID=3156264 RepID=UPI003512EE24